jgi:hypothetical protein
MTIDAWVAIALTFVGLSLIGTAVYIRSRALKELRAARPIRRIDRGYGTLEDLFRERGQDG